MSISLVSFVFVTDFWNRRSRDQRSDLDKESFSGDQDQSDGFLSSVEPLSVLDTIMESTYDM